MSKWKCYGCSDVGCRDNLKPTCEQPTLTEELTDNLVKLVTLPLVVGGVIVDTIYKVFKN